MNFETDKKELIEIKTTEENTASIHSECLDNDTNLYTNETFSFKNKYEIIETIEEAKN